jgi:toxin ParE1/3/4
MWIEGHPEAWQEFFQAADRYESATPGVGRRFRVEIAHCLMLLAEHPSIGHLEGRRARRRVVDDGFPYSRVYQVRTDLIPVVSIAHHSRRPGDWRHRVARQLQNATIRAG